MKTTGFVSHRNGCCQRPARPPGVGRRRIGALRRDGSIASAFSLGLLIAFVALLPGLFAQELDARPGPGRYYVALNGNDAWSGKLPEPNPTKTDGPFATLARAQQAHLSGKLRTTIFVRGGTYYLSEPLLFTPADSGAQYVAYPGERPVLSGGRPITGWRKGPTDVWAAQIPEVRAGKWLFRQLRVGDKPQVLARYPNFDPANPYQGGWLFTTYDGPKVGALGAAIGRIHYRGDWIEWTVDVPAGDDYRLWFYYAALNRQFGFTDLAGRMTIQVGGSPALPLKNLPDTGSFANYRWSPTATLTLTEGSHILRWTNVEGGGLNLDALMLTDDPNWTPGKRPAAGRNAIVIQAESFSSAQCREMQVPETPAPAFRDRFQFKLGDLKAYPRSPDPEIHIFPAAGWVNTILHVKSIDQGTRVVQVEENSNASQEIRVGNRYFISNVFEELDTPGEWYLERSAGVLYYWPPTPAFEKLGVVAPVLDRLIEFRGDPARNQWVEEVIIQGFEFTDTAYSRNIAVYSPNDAAIWLAGARKCVIEKNRFLNLGGYAVRLENRSADNEIVGNEIAYGGQGGVILLGSVATQPKNNLIAGNWVHHLGQIYKHVAGVYAVTASGTRVAHNRFEYLPRYAVSFKSFDANNYSHDNVTEYNEMLFTNMETSDSGAIETLGRHKRDTGNIIQYNRIFDSVGLNSTLEGKLVSPYFSWGIYLDDYSSGTTVRGNVVARNDWGGLCLHGGRNNVIENNVFVDGQQHQIRYQVRDEFCASNRLVRNIISFNQPKADLFKHTGQWRASVLAESNHNLFWHAQGASFFRDRNLTPLTTLVKWQATGLDRASVLADPLFVDRARDDYRVKPESPALRLGFEPIPWEKIGMQEYPRAWKQ